MRYLVAGLLPSSCDQTMLQIIECMWAESVHPQARALEPGAQFPVRVACQNVLSQCAPARNGCPYWPDGPDAKYGDEHVGDCGRAQQAPARNAEPVDAISTPCGVSLDFGLVSGGIL